MFYPCLRKLKKCRLLANGVPIQSYVEFSAISISFVKSTSNSALSEKLMTFVSVSSEKGYVIGKYLIDTHSYIIKLAENF